MGFLLRLWPVFIPLILYVLWVLWKQRQAKKHGGVAPTFLGGPWLWAVSASLVMAAMMLIWLGLSQPKQGAEGYRPAEMTSEGLRRGTLQP